MKDIKESNPIEVAEYAVSREIHNEPAFVWWINKTLKMRDKIIKQVRSRLANRGMKYGVIVPNNVEEAEKLDKDNGNTYWADAIAKELKNVRITFKLLEENEMIPVGSS